jgi:ubiquinone/menaquinone biosynthesis C-methylase UbiE
MKGVTDELSGIIRGNKFSTVLEAGCGTGYWLKSLEQISAGLFGVDISSGMLRYARRNNSGAGLICANANLLPFNRERFDLIYCVNAFHQFTNKKEFIFSASRLLKRKGILAIIGLDPSSRENEWYVYEFFAGVLENDLERFPPFGQIEEWMSDSGFFEVKRKIVERTSNNRRGKEVFDDNFLLKTQTSQLAALSEAEYLSGMKRLGEAVIKDPERVFSSRMNFTAITGRRP